MIAATATGAALNSASTDGGVLNKILKIILVISLIVGLLVGAYLLFLLIDNWSLIASFFTSGFIGWLNPFDNPAGDTGPVEAITGSSRPWWGYLNPLTWFITS